MNITEQKERYTREELAGKFEVSGTQVMYWQFGRTRKQTANGKTTYEPAILDTTDYESTLENGRNKYYYFQSAVDKITGYLKEKEKI